MLFRRKIPRSCSICQFGTAFAEHQVLCLKQGVVADTFACRKYKYDPCKRIPPCAKAPDFDKFRNDDFKLD